MTEISFSPEFNEDPYPVLTAAREQGVVVRDAIQGWWVLDPNLVGDVLRSHKFGKALADAEDGFYKQMLGAGNFSLLYMHGEEHRRVRGLVNRAFTPRAVEAMAPHIQDIVDTLLDEAGDSFDLMTAFAGPLPIIVIAEMLGIDTSRRDDFARWSREVIETFDPTIDPERREYLAGSMLEFATYIQEAVAARRTRPTDDLIGRLVHVQDEDGARLSDEVFGLVTLLLVAGNITTTDIIGNALLALFANPDQFELLRSDPCLAGVAVEETLRYDSSVVGTDRIALEDVELGGCPIRKGEWVQVSAAAANRDPRAVPDPERFDITRNEFPHASFGGGVHFCLGAGLARLEATIALRTIATRYPELRLDGEPKRRSGMGLRGVEYLPVATR